MESREGGDEGNVVLLSKDVKLHSAQLNNTFLNLFNVYKVFLSFQ